MSKIYLFGYILLFFTSKLCPDNIDTYFSLKSAMQKYLDVVIHAGLDSKAVEEFLKDEECIQSGIESASELIKSCIINSSKFSSSASSSEKTNGIIQIILATYLVLQNVYGIFCMKQEQKNWLSSLRYSEVIVKFPHIILIEYQIKMMKLLLEMHYFGNVAERAFARIYLGRMILPGPYGFITKKIVKKIYKNYFNKAGTLISIDPADNDKLHTAFLKKGVPSWSELILKVTKFPTKLCLVHASSCDQIIGENIYNKDLLELIDAGRIQDRDIMDRLLSEHQDDIFLSIYNFYTNQN